MYLTTDFGPCGCDDLSYLFYLELEKGFIVWQTPSFPMCFSLLWFYEKEDWKNGVEFVMHAQTTVLCSSLNSRQSQYLSKLFDKFIFLLWEYDHHLRLELLTLAQCVNPSVALCLYYQVATPLQLGPGWIASLCVKTEIKSFALKVTYQERGKYIS